MLRWQGVPECEERQEIRKDPEEEAEGVIEEGEGLEKQGKGESEGCKDAGEDQGSAERRNP